MTRKEISVLAREARLKCRHDIGQVVRPAVNSREVVILSTTEIMRLVWGGGKIIPKKRLVRGKSGELETRTKAYWEVANNNVPTTEKVDWRGATVTGDESLCPWGSKFVGQNLEMMGFEKERTHDKRGWFVYIV